MPKGIWLAHTFLLVFTVTAVPWFPASARTYYVSTKLGNDSYNGLSKDMPWRTISRVNASNFLPGDQVLFERGGVWNEQLVIPSSGSSLRPIIFGSYGTGERPRISRAPAGQETDLLSLPPPDAQHDFGVPSEAAILASKVELLQTIGKPTEVAKEKQQSNQAKQCESSTLPKGLRDYCIRISGKRFVTVQDFTISDATNCGIAITHNSSFITLSHNYIHTIGNIGWRSGIVLGGATNCKIYNNIIQNCFTSITLSGWNNAQSHNNVVRNNISMSSASVGINLTSGPGVTDNLIQNNMILAANQLCDDGAGIYLYRAGQNNVIAGNQVGKGGTKSSRSAGIMVDDFSGPTHVIENFLWENSHGGIDVTGWGHIVKGNLLYMNNQFSADAGEINVFSTAHGAARITISDNLAIASLGKHSIRVRPNCTEDQFIDSNVYYGTDRGFEWDGISYDFEAWKQLTGHDVRSRRFTESPLGQGMLEQQRLKYCERLLESAGQTALHMMETVVSFCLSQQLGRQEYAFPAYSFHNPHFPPPYGQEQDSTQDPMVIDRFYDVVLSAIQPSAQIGLLRPTVSEIP